MSSSSLAPTFASYPEPHLLRTRAILKNHPEVTALFGNTPSTAFFIVGVVAIQIAAAVVVARYDWAWWQVLLLAYTLGAVANHALWTLIHECTHNLVWRTSWANQVWGCIANLPIGFPAAINFRNYHLKHHAFQGDLDRDADLARPLEARLVGNVWWRKALWLLFFPIWQSLRVRSIKGIPFITPWVIGNWFSQAAFLTALGFAAGPSALLYIGLSSFFAVGLHPVGARWIQEHYTVKAEQETYSYYGPLNRVAFNVGYHNEHHDLMRVPWSRLPQVRAIAPELYETLHWHRSWTALLFKFLFDPKLSLASRVYRGEKATRMAERAGLPVLLAPGSAARGSRERSLAEA